MSLVTTNWLKENLNSPNITILDCTWHLPTTQRSGHKEFLKERIPGAIFFDIDKFSDENSPYAHMLLSDESFSEKASQLGLKNDHHIIVYDTIGIFSAARAWWMFKHYGHKNVSILNGGMVSWKKNNFTLETKAPKVLEKSFYAAKSKPEEVVTFDEVKKNIENKTFQLIDARPQGRFSGKDPEPRKGIKSGSVSNSINIPFTECINPADGTLKSKEDLKKIFDAKKIDPSMPAVFSCGSGVAACVVGKAFETVTDKKFRIYDGSWTEWALRNKLTDN